MNQLLQGSPRRDTFNFNGWLPAWLVAGLLALSGLALSTAGGLAASYTISIPTGFSLIANHLDSGGNTLQEVLPGVPNGTEIRKHNCNNNYTTDTMVAGVWTPAGTTLKPGEGAYIVNNSGSPFNLTFTGTPHVPVLPPPLPCGCGDYNVVSRQTTNAPTIFEDIMGFAPPDQAQLLKWSGAGFITYTYDLSGSGGWVPSVPSVGLGQSVFIRLPACAGAPLITCATNKTVNGCLAWSFDAPTNITVNCYTNGALTVTTVTNSGPCPLVTTRTWVIRDVCGNSNSCSQTVTVNCCTNFPPVITAQPISQTVLEGQNATLSVTASGTAPLSYQWKRGTTNIVAGTNATLTLTNVTVGQTATNYSVMVTNSSDSVTSRPTALTVLVDFDRDGMWDNWERAYGLNTNSVADAALDSDGDGVTNRLEFVLGTDPRNATNVQRLAVVSYGSNGTSLLVTFTVTYGLAQLQVTNYQVTSSLGHVVPILYVLPGTINRRVTLVLAEALEAGQSYQLTLIAPTAQVEIGDFVCNSVSLSSFLCPPTNMVGCLGQPITLEAGFCEPNGGFGLNFALKLDGNTGNNATATTASPDGNPYSAKVRFTFNFITPGTHTVRIIASDGFSSPVECDVAVQIDTTAPIITGFPAGGSLGCNPTTLPSDADVQAQVTATDNYGVAAMNVTHVDGGTACASNRTFTITVTDACTNMATTNVVYTWTADAVPPVITSCPANVAVQCFADIPAANAAAVGATDNCTPAASLIKTHVGDVPVTNGCSITVTRTYRVTDACTNPAFCVQTITVSDTIPPVINACAPNRTLVANASCTAVLPDLRGDVNWTDNCGATLSQSPLPGTIIGIGPQIVTLTVTDGCGNFVSCQATVTVVDQTPPIITCPPNVTVQCDANVPAANFAGGSVSDNCGATVTHVGDAATGSCPKTITRTYKATDASANMATCTQTITVRDTIPPVLAGVPANVTVQCLGDVPAPANVTATDNCDVTLTPVLVSATNGVCPTIITRTWTATDRCTNSASATRTITVLDTTLPVITNCPANVAVQCFADIPAANAAAVGATDNCTPAASLIKTHVGDVRVTNGCSITVTRTYRVTDACTNAATCVQTITVSDTLPPVITSCPNNVSVQCFANVPSAAPGTVVATDNCTPAGSLVKTHVGDVRVTNGCVITVTRTYRVTDACTNAATCVQTIIVSDTIPPVITSCGATQALTGTVVNGQCQATIPDYRSLVVATDNCGPITIAQSPIGTTVGAGTYSLVFTVTDACSNAVRCTNTVIVQCPGTLMLACPENISICTNNGPCAPMPDVTSLVSVTSACLPVTLTQSVHVTSSVCANSGPFGVVVMATDSCGVVRECFIPFVFERCCTPPPANMTLWLTFDEKVGNVAFNSRGGNHGTLYDGASVATSGTGPAHDGSGYVARSLNFDGVNDYVQVPTYSGISIGTSDFTVDAWVKPASLSSDIRVIVDHREQSGLTRGYSLFLGGNNGLAFQIGDGAAFINYPSQVTVPADGKWHHVAVTVQRANAAGIRFYLDGVWDGLGRDPTPYPLSLTPAAGYPFRVGARSSSLTGFFPGGIDEVEVFCRSLGSNEVQSIYRAREMGKCKIDCHLDWDVAVCTNGPGTTVPVQGTLFNHSASPVTVTYSWAGLPANATCVPGPTTFTPSSGSVTIPANSSVNIPVTITVPPWLGPNQQSCYQLVVTVSGTGERFACQGSLQGLNNLCVGVTGGGGLLGNTTNAIAWTISNTSAATLAANYQVLTYGPGMILTTNVGVTPVSGTINIAAGSSSNLVTLVYIRDCDPNQIIDVVLVVNGQAVGSRSIWQVQPATVVTAQADLVVTTTWQGSTGVVTVVNTGTVAASNVVLNFTLSGGVAPLDPDCSLPVMGEDGLFDSTCALGTLPANGSATRRFQPALPGIISQLVAAEAITTTPESNLDNNSADAWSTGRPNILVQPQSLDLGSNGLDGVECVVGGNGLGLQWYRDGTSLPGETNETLLVSSAGSYQAVAFNASGSSTSAVAIINILPLAWIDRGGILPGFEQNLLPRGDDHSTGRIPFCFTNAICFCGSNYTGLYVNNNGNVTFDGPFGQYSPTALCSLNRAILAPHWSDVDTRNTKSGRVSWGCGSVVVPGVGLRPAFVATWKKVGYYYSHADKKNTYQLVIIDRSDRGAGEWDLQYRYKKLRWDTGDASGGANGFCASTPSYPARAGYANRNLCCSELPGSGQCFGLRDANAATGLINHHIGDNPNGIYTWEFVGCSPRPQDPGCEPTNNLASALPRGDDTFLGPIPLCFNGPICFYGRNYSSLYINNNGSVTFGGGLATFTPGSFATAGLPIIAPFWADVDTRPGNGGQVRYGCVSRYVNGVGYRPTFIVAWDNVGYFANHTDKKNSFQLHIIDRSDRAPGDFDFKFCYDKIQWETGDASGGNNGFGGFTAHAGFGDGVSRLYSLPGSGVSGAFLDSNTGSGLIHNRLNSTADGVYCISITNCVPNVQSNRAPVAKARGTTNCVNAMCCALVTLSSAGTYDPDGDALTYLWKEGATTLSTAPSPAVTICGVGLHVITLTVNDGRGHSVTTTANVLLRDCTPPVITGCPTNTTVVACSNNIPDLRNNVGFTDTCSAPGSIVVTQVPAPGTPVGPGVYPITIKVCDTSGNCATCVAIFTVEAVKTASPSASRVFNTGVNAARAQLAVGAADPHFTLISRPPGGPTTAIVVAQNAGWNAPGTGSRFIATSTAWDDLPGIYVFRTYITNDCDVRSMSVEGRWAVDDAVELWVDGQLRASRYPPPAPFQSWQDFSFAGLGYGVHIADFVVSNFCCPIGLRVEWTNYCACPTNSPCLPPYITSQPQNVALPVLPTPPGYTATFTVTTGGSGPLFYQWYCGNTVLNDSVLVSGSHTASLTLRPPSLTNYYYCVISNNCGSVTSRVARFYGGPIIVSGGFNGPVFRVTAATIRGQSYQLVRSDSIATTATSDWKVVVEAVAVSETTVLDDPEPHPLMRFYRVTTPTPPDLEP